MHPPDFIWWSYLLEQGMLGQYGGIQLLSTCCSSLVTVYAGHVRDISYICVIRVPQGKRKNVGQYDWDYAARGMDFLSHGGFASVS